MHGHTNLKFKLISFWFSSFIFFSFFSPHFFFQYCISFYFPCSFVSFSPFITSCSQIRFLSSPPLFYFRLFFFIWSLHILHLHFISSRSSILLFYFIYSSLFPTSSTTRHSFLSCFLPSSHLTFSFITVFPSIFLVHSFHFLPSLLPALNFVSFHRLPFFTFACISLCHHSTSFIFTVATIFHTLFSFCGAATQRGSWPPHSWCF